MSAIENWKGLYKSWHNIDFTNEIVFRSDFYSIRREAALERIIERQQRRITKLEHQLESENIAPWQ